VQQRLVGRAFGETPLLQDLHELCDGTGGRLRLSKKTGTHALGLGPRRVIRFVLFTG
jgi:hypothetical protein